VLPVVQNLCCFRSAQKKETAMFAATWSKIAIGLALVGLAGITWNWHSLGSFALPIERFNSVLQILQHALR
jgi:hypothetical protein